jgi:flagellar FliL protein
VAEDKVQEAPEEEAAEGEGGEGGKPKKKLSMKVMLMAGAGALVVLGGGGAAFIFLKPKPDAAHSGKAAKKPAKKGGEKGKKDDRVAGQVTEGPDGVLFYTMPDVVVNMQTADGRPTFLKL